MSAVTKSSKRLQLTDKQNAAIRELIKGKADSEVAKAVGVSRKTISKWKNENPYFQAELNIRREEVWGNFLSDYQEILTGSLQTIKNAIANGDVRTAIWFIERNGIDIAFSDQSSFEKPIDPTDPDHILWLKAFRVAGNKIGKEPGPLDKAEFIMAGRSYVNEDEVKEEAERVFAKLKTDAVKQQTKELSPA